MVAGAAGLLALPRAKLRADPLINTLSLLRDLAATAGEENVLFSPVNLSSALAVLELGAGGSTKSQLSGLAQSLPAVASLPGTGPNTQLRQGVLLWSSASASFAPAFLSQASSRFGATSVVGDVAQAESQIGRWAAEITQRQIRNIPVPIGGNGSVVLLAALRFSARWAEPFDAARTSVQPFAVARGRRVSVPMMARSGNFDFARQDGVDVVRLPYSDPPWCLTIALPNATLDLDAWLGRLDAVRLGAVLGTLEATRGQVRLPRLRLLATKDMRATLERHGIMAAFQPGAADFSPMLGVLGPFLAGVTHQVAMEVDERGTQAAAVTSMNVIGSLPLRFDLVVDRPFFFAIHGAAGDPPLFMGVVRNPVWSS